MVHIAYSFKSTSASIRGKRLERVRNNMEIIVGFNGKERKIF